MYIHEILIVALRWKAVLILFFILLSLIPVYSFNQFLQKWIRPRESIGRLFLYLFIGMFTVFLFVAILVFLIKLVYPTA